MFAGCGQQEPAAAPLAAPPPADSGPVAAAPGPAVEAPKEAPKPAELTPEQTAKQYQDCWGAFNGKDWAKFSGCYADNASSEMVDSGMPPLVGKDIVERGTKPFGTAFPDATGEAQLTLVNGNNVVGVWLIRGTNKAAMPGPTGELPPTNKKIGYLVGQTMEFKAGKTTQEQLFADTHTMLAQLGVVPGPARKVLEQGVAEKPLVLALNNDAEKANVEAYKKYSEAFDKHDAPGVEALLTDDFVFSDQTAPADLVGKKEASKGIKEIWKGMSDAKMEIATIWGAGDYVVSTGSFKGVNDGPIPSMKLWKKTGKPVNVKYLSVAQVSGGKLKREWIFGNGMAMANQLGLLPPEKKPTAAPTGKPPAASGPTATAPTKPGATPTAATPSGPKGATPTTPAPQAGTPPPAAAKGATPTTPATPKATAPVAPAAPKAVVPVAPAKPAPAPAK
jgi:ketosteroid isomerase-like protein